MDSKCPIKSEIISNVRDMAMNRCGGVQTRGRRLPSLSVRELTQITGNKKVVAPNIPQRRRIIKTEVETRTQPIVKAEKPSHAGNSRGRDRGRKQRVFLQTEGAFLAEGPAARIKRDPAYEDSVSVVRASRKGATASSDKNTDSETIQYLLDSYVAGEEYENDFQEKPPFRLPLQKENIYKKVQLKYEEEDIKPEIKKELYVDIETGIEKEIKAEKNVDYKESSSTKVDFVYKEETDSKLNLRPIADDFQNVKDDGLLILLQLPLLSDASKKDMIDKNKQTEKENLPKVTTNFVDTLEEGFIGKLKIMKSGRMKILLGSMEFELLDGSQSETYQEAVSIQIRENEGDMTVIGPVSKKLVLSPMMANLIGDTTKTNKAVDF